VRNVEMEYEKIIELIHEIEHSSITEFQLQKGEFQISLKKQGCAEPTTADIPKTVHKELEAEPKKEAEEVSIKEGVIIRSPMVGIFHASASQDKKDIVTTGQTIEEGQVLGAIEAMKMMNDVVAGCSGTVTEVLVGDGELVEYGQPLFVIEG